MIYAFALVAALLAVVAIIKGEGPITAVGVLVLALGFVVQHAGWLR